MNRLHYKNPDNLKSDINQLIDFGRGEDIVHFSPRGKDQRSKDRNLSLLDLPSKYATILHCSFEKDQKTNLGVKILP